MSKINNVRALTQDVLCSLVDTYQTKGKILLSLGISPNDNRSKKVLTELLTKYNIDYTSRRRQFKYTDVDIINAVKTSFSISEILDRVHLPKHGSNFKLMRYHIIRLNIDISHLHPNNGRIIRSGRKLRSKDTIFIEHSDIGRGNLKGYVIKFAVLGNYECHVCKNDGKWLLQPLDLTIDHINGVPTDNRIENLRWLCPNCHSQTHNFGGKNTKRNHI